MKWHQIFFWLLLLFLPTQLGFYFWPDWATVLGRRVDYLAPTIYLTDVLLFATLFFWFFESFSRIRNQESGIRRYVKQIKIIFSTKIHNSGFMILFLVFAAVNIFVAENQMVALYKWIKVTEFLLLGWYIVRTKPKLLSLVIPLSIGVFFSSVLAIVQFVLQHSVGGPLWWLGERTFNVDTPGIARTVLRGRELLRPYGTFPHPNVLGGYLAVLLPGITQYTNNPIIKLSNRIKIFYGSVLAVGVIALLLTFSRSAIIVAILAFVFVFFQKNKIFFFFAILFLTFSLPCRQAGVIRFPFTFFEESVVVRQQLNIAAVKIWQSSPLFGVGLGNFLVRLPEALPTRTIYFLQPVHNIYLLLLSEIGAVGVAGVVGVVWVAIRKKKRILFVPLIAYLLLGFVDHYPLTLQQGQLMLTILAALCIRGVTYEKN